MEDNIEGRPNRSGRILIQGRQDSMKNALVMGALVMGNTSYILTRDASGGLTDCLSGRPGVQDVQGRAGA